MEQEGIKRLLRGSSDFVPPSLPQAAHSHKDWMAGQDCVLAACRKQNLLKYEESSSSPKFSAQAYVSLHLNTVLNIMKLFTVQKLGLLIHFKVIH